MRCFRVLSRQFEALPAGEREARGSLCGAIRAENLHSFIYIYIIIYYDRIARGVSEEHGQTKLHSNGAVHTAFEHDLIKLHKREKNPKQDN